MVGHLLDVVHLLLCRDSPLVMHYRRRGMIWMHDHDTHIESRGLPVHGDCKQCKAVEEAVSYVCDIRSNLWIRWWTCHCCVKLVSKHFNVHNRSQAKTCSTAPAPVAMQRGKIIRRLSSVLHSDQAILFGAAQLSRPFHEMAHLLAITHQYHVIILYTGLHIQP